ncbi:MAG: TonB-dependent receptor [Chitinophagaceae bacterium]|nr:TonB-dependent receptor [Chitinophagaceae bacterium]
MKKIITYFAILIAVLPVTPVLAQDSAFSKNLEEVVVTGQYKPQTLKKSVYQVRVINNERIKQSGATNVQQVLNNQLGFRFSSDNTIGTTDVQLMGMSGRNVKILLDGIPLVDRGDTRESLGQVDINSIERIEIVEGPMSVSYGSDALAGVINIITKKYSKDHFSLTAKVQEETAGSDYHPFHYKGVHHQHLNMQYKKNAWGFTTGATHNDFNGFGGDAFGRGKTWKPKEQWMGNAKFSYDKGPLNVYYRIDALHEDIQSKGAINYGNYKAIDQQYISNRILQQLQGSYAFSNKLQMATVIGYTDYKRRTKTTRHDFEKDTDELTTGEGEQDISTFTSFVFRTTFQYQLSNKLSLQPGIDINSESAGGQRILDEPRITDYAAFISAEIKPTSKINIRPGLRFIKNSDYDAPPVIPSINSKFILNKQLDLRFAYAYGFRAPALRELYFYYVDVNHNIVGNPNLKAETSNSFTGSLNWTPYQKNNKVYQVSLSGFYNQFNNQIDFETLDSVQYTYLNINNAKTAGFSVENRLTAKNLDASLGLSYIGFYRQFYNDKIYVNEVDKKYLWSPEINASVGYSITAIKTRLNLFYKLTGKRPQLVTGINAANQQALLVAETEAYHLADLTANTQINKYISVSAGVKNIFDVTNARNTAVASNSIHNAGSAVAVGYGRSAFVGLQFQWNKK